MKEIGCRDMGVNCNFVAKGTTDEEVKKALWSHAEKAHAEVIKSLTADKRNEMSAMMDALLKKGAATKH
jgi:predicted small metal-binding protein